MRFTQKLSIVIFSAILLSSFLFSCDDSDSSSDKAASSKVVSTTEGDLRGYSGDGNTWVFKGVPYGKAPVRWQAPQDPDTWTGVRNADEYGNVSPQYPYFTSYVQGDIDEENCLNLNIIAPKTFDTTANPDGLPVMVSFHGGRYGILASNTDLFNNELSLPQEGVVLVTVNHRLGIFGYLANPILAAEFSYGGSGNYGQLDLIMALKWVQRNIAAFGGNPDNVTIFGQSGGGGKVTSLLLSPLANGLFHKAICESGILPHDDQATAESLSTNLINQLIADGDLPASPTLADLRALDWETLVNADVAANTINSWVIYGPCVDNHYLYDTYDNLIAAGIDNDVPLMLGCTTYDLVPGIANLHSDTEQYSQVLADSTSAAKYVYLFDHIPSGWASYGAMPYHGIDLIYVFNDGRGYITAWKMGFLAAYLTDTDIGSTPTDADYWDNVLASTGFYGTAEYASSGNLVPIASEQTLCDNMMAMWTNFAKTGDPSVTGVITWPEFQTGAGNYQFLMINQDTSLTIEGGFADSAAFEAAYDPNGLD